MGMDDRTSGFAGWKEVQVFEGRDEANNNVGREGFRNIIDGRFAIPENGWDGAPPKPTGDLACVRHTSEAYRRGYDQIRWEK
jgi:hypothetical protein